MKTKLTVKTELEILLPTLPDFVRTANNDVCMPIYDLTDDQIRELGNYWTNALIDKSRKKRSEKIRAINKQLGNL
jgi:hypothetical protein